MRRHSYGLTLIELLITIAVLGVLGAIAFPGMSDYMDKQRLVSQVRAISNLAQLARSEAIKRSATANSADVKTVSMTVSPGSAWFVGLSNGTAACSGSTCVINEGGSSVSHTVLATECSGCTMTAPTLSDGPQVITFDLRGLATGAANQAITLSSPKGKQLSLSVSRLGRISLCTPAGVGSISGYATC